MTSGNKSATLTATQQEVDMGNAFRQRPAGQSGRVHKIKPRKPKVIPTPKPALTLEQMEAEFARIQSQMEGLIDDSEFR